jgi:hypothetical protein
MTGQVAHGWTAMKTASNAAEIRLLIRRGMRRGQRASGNIETKLARWMVGRQGRPCQRGFFALVLVTTPGRDLRGPPVA